MGSIASFTIIFAIFKNEVIKFIQSIFLNTRPNSSLFILISTSSLSPSIFCYDLIFTLFGLSSFNEIIKVIKLILGKLDQSTPSLQLILATPF